MANTIFNMSPNETHLVVRSIVTAAQSDIKHYDHLAVIEKMKLLHDLVYAYSATENERCKTAKATELSCGDQAPDVEVTT